MGKGQTCSECGSRTFFLYTLDGRDWLICSGCGATETEVKILKAMRMITGGPGASTAQCVCCKTMGFFFREALDAFGLICSGCGVGVAEIRTVKRSNGAGTVE